MSGCPLLRGTTGLGWSLQQRVQLLLLSEALIDRQRNGRREDIIGVIASLHFEEPFGVFTVALGRTDEISLRKEIRIPAGQHGRTKAV